jgi:hypothetical protein
MNNRRFPIRSSWFRQKDNTIELIGKVIAFKVNDSCAIFSIFKSTVRAFNYKSR